MVLGGTTFILTCCLLINKNNLRLEREIEGSGPDGIDYITKLVTFVGEMAPNISVAPALRPHLHYRIEYLSMAATALTITRGGCVGMRRSRPHLRLFCRM